MDRHHEMRVFQAVATDLSLAAAARRLNISPPSVTRAIASLEARLGQSLITRSTRGVQLTPTGERFAADCQRILQEVEEAEASASGLHTQPRGHLTLAMPLLFGQQLVTPLLPDYLSTYPDVQLLAQYLDRFPNLHEEGIDVAVLVGELPDSSLFALKVGSIRRVICASPEYLKHQRAPQTPEQISQHRIVHSSADARLPEWRFNQQGVVRHVSLRPQLSCSNNQSAIAAACLGAGLTRCMSYQIHDLVAEGKLTVLLQKYELPALPVHVVYREGRKAAASVRTLVDFIVGKLREHPALLINTKEAGTSPWLSRNSSKVVACAGTSVSLQPVPH